MIRDRDRNWVLAVFAHASVVCGLLPIQTAHAQDFPLIANLAELEALTDQPWTNSLGIIPPGVFTYKTDLGVILYPDGFAPEFLSGLLSATNSGVEMFPVCVVETNTTPRQRLYLGTTGVAAHTTTVSLVGYPSNCIVASYGATPGYLDQTNRTQWFEERDPMRQRVCFTLLAQSNAATYQASLTNACVITLDETNTFSLLDAYSNAIAFVKTGPREDGVFEYYLHAPATVTVLDVYTSTNLLDPLGGWSMPVRLNHVSDPLCGMDASQGTTVFFAAGNPVVDTDGDGIPDCMEQVC